MSPHPHDEIQQIAHKAAYSAHPNSQINLGLSNRIADAVAVAVTEHVITLIKARADVETNVVKPGMWFAAGYLRTTLELSPLAGASVSPREEQHDQEDQSRSDHPSVTRVPDPRGDDRDGSRLSCGALVGHYGAGYTCARKVGHAGDHSPVPDPTDVADTGPRPNIEVARQFIGLMREAFDVGFNAGWDTDGTPVTFTEQMDEAWREFENRVPPLKVGSHGNSPLSEASGSAPSAAPSTAFQVDLTTDAGDTRRRLIDVVARAIVIEDENPIGRLGLNAAREALTIAKERYLAQLGGEAPSGPPWVDELLDTLMAEIAQED